MRLLLSSNRRDLRLATPNKQASVPDGPVGALVLFCEDIAPALVKEQAQFVLHRVDPQVSWTCA